MHKKLLIGILFTLFIIGTASAQINDQLNYLNPAYESPTENSFPITHWASANPQDSIVVQNGTGAMLTIYIAVNGGANAAGVSINNCGETNHVDAGSSVFCVTSDADNPVSFSSDSGNYAASGSYEIKQE